MSDTLPNAKDVAMNKIPCLHGAYILLEGDRLNVICQMVVSTEKNKKERKRLGLNKDAVLGTDIQRKPLPLTRGINH